MDAILSTPVGIDIVPTSSHKANVIDTLHALLPSEDETNTANSAALEPGYEAWTVTIEHPDHEHLERSVGFPHTKLTQWVLSYRHGCFPLQRGTTISFCDQPYLLLSVGSNSLRVRALTPQAFTSDPARYVSETGTFQMTPVRQEQLRHRRDNRRRSGRGNRSWRLVDEPHFQPTTTLRLSYELAVRDVPWTLRDDLPAWARGGSDEEPVSLSRRCYVQLYILDAETNQLVAWDPTMSQADDEALLPDHGKIALETTALADAPVYRLSADEASMLAERMVQPERSAHVTFVAPASFLPEELRTMIAPELSHVVSAETAAIEPEQPLFQEVYYELSGLTYDDRERGRLYLAYVATLVDRLSGRQTGPVQVVWLTRKQIRQSLRWDASMKQLDTHELQVQVNAHARERGADLPQVPSREEAATKKHHHQHQAEELYNRVPLRDPYSGAKNPKALELFVSDLDVAEFHHRSPRSAMRQILERYMKHPQLLPAGEHQLTAKQIRDVRAALQEDQQQVRQLNETWARLFPGNHHPDTRAFVFHPAYTVRTKTVWDERKRKYVTEQAQEHIGYRVIIGVLATVSVPKELKLEVGHRKAVA